MSTLVLLWIKRWWSATASEPGRPKIAFHQNNTRGRASVGVWLQLLVRWWDTHLTVQIEALLYRKTPRTFREKKIYIYYHISWNLHQQISLTSKMLVRVQVLDSTHRTRSKQSDFWSNELLKCHCTRMHLLSGLCTPELDGQIRTTEVCQC